ncbi:MAG: hypothetical protein CL452_04125 [Acidimicrobiaceae bacterium]|nr:hypothetical protein [Acidimicrobiaceae bacterium]
MNIEKGRSWGSLSPLPPEGVIIKTNKELLEKVNDCKRQGIDLPTFGLLGGDLWRTLGGRRAEERLYGGEATTLDIDLGCALLDGKIFWFCAHMFIGSKLKGEKIFISNVAHYGKMNPAPKAHPGDGKFDMLEVKLSPFQTFKAVKRVSAGTHIPHPGIKYKQVSSEQFSFGKKLSIEIDGKNIGKFSTVSIRIENEALRVVI